VTDGELERPIWDRGDAIDAGMLAFTIGDDWLQDRRLVEHDLCGSLAHAAGLAHAGLISGEDAEAIRRGLEQLLESHRSGEWTVESGDEDVHSAIERRLIQLVGEPGKRLHTGRSRNDQVALDVRLWLRDALAATGEALAALRRGCFRFAEQHGSLPLPGYTHLRRAMPSSMKDWIAAHARALELDAIELEHAQLRTRECPLGSGAGYGVPLALDRAFTAEALGFDRPEEPVTFAQHSRGRPELAYVTALEGIALDLGKLAADLWLFTTSEFGFARLPTAFTTGSSMMPQKRNPDVVELTRAHARQVACDRVALLDVVRDLPSGYHRDFQLIKPPLFRAHDRSRAMLELWARLLPEIELDAEALQAAAADPSLAATQRALEATKEGVAFRDAYRTESRSR
jgi:argininosuccinate lyase